MKLADSGFRQAMQHLNSGVSKELWQLVKNLIAKHQRVSARDDFEQEVTSESLRAFVRTHEDGGVEDNPHWCGR